jgi:uncharacterized YccA/Bax inhibitor family protein
MAIFEKSTNPAMKDSIFAKSVVAGTYSGAMTVKGAVIKTLLLLAMTILAAAWTWNMAFNALSPSTATPWMIGGLIAGLVLALIICFAPKTAPYLSPLYAAAEGLFLGAISAFFEQMFAESYPGIVFTAVAITLLTALVMLFCYMTRIIKVTNKFRSVLIIATASIAVFYLVTIVMSLFGVSSFYYGTSWLSIGVSVVIVIVAALNLLLDFDFIEKGAQAGAPKYMEWYGAFGLMLTLIWLYLEILRLLAKFAGRE